MIFLEHASVAQRLPDADLINALDVGFSRNDLVAPTRSADLLADRPTGGDIRLLMPGWRPLWCTHKSTAPCCRPDWGSYLDHVVHRPPMTETPKLSPRQVECLTRIARGETNLSIDNLERLADALKMPASELLVADAAASPTPAGS